jgi:virginiamycin A acetyltransferase
MSTFVGMVPFGFGELLRYYYYHLLLNNVGKNVHFQFGCHFSYRDISIGDNVRIGYCSTFGLTDIGNDVLIAASCSFTSGARMHGFDRTDIPIRLQEGAGLQRIRIGNDVWIGIKSIVMADVCDGAVVGSGSVVTKPIPEYAIAFGNPARVIRMRK